MLELGRKEKIAICIFLIVLSMFVGFKLRPSSTNETIIQSHPVESTNDSIIQSTKDEIEELDNANEIMVDICGEIVHPGVFKLEEGSRVIDAVNMAGGLLETADRKKVNLARIVEDGEQIYIPAIGEIIDSIDINNEYSVQKGSGKININNASQSELETLSGIGEVLAKRIIQHREEKGVFNKIEEIMDVSGIGTKKFEDIKSKITTK